MKKENEEMQLEKIASGVGQILEGVILPENVGADENLTNEIIEDLSDDYVKLNNYVNQYLKMVRKCDNALRQAQGALDERKLELENNLLKYYTTEQEIIRKVGDTQITVKELPKIKNKLIKLRELEKLTYDEPVLLQYEKFVKIKKVLDKIAVRAEYKQTGKVDGLKAEKVKTLKIKV
jgi:acyl carrier protein phosphodiesterase